MSLVISAIYEAALSSERWRTALASISAFVGGSSALMFWHDTNLNGVETIYSFGDDPYYTRLYIDSHARLNPVFPAASFLSVGTVTTASDLVPDEEIRQTRFYREYMRPQGITDALATTLETDGPRAAFLGLQWTSGLVDPEARRRMTLLVPHLRRAVAIGRLFLARSEREVALTATLDQFVDGGVFLLAPGSRVVFANAQGRRMLAQSDLLLGSTDRLLPQDAAAAEALSAGLSRITDGRIGSDEEAISLVDGFGATWTLTVVPLDGAERRRRNAHPDAIAAVLVRPRRPPPISPLQVLAERHCLTASEVRVVEAALRISGIGAQAEALGISRSTVKTHLNRTLRKCGARNQADLLRLIGGLAALGEQPPPTRPST